MNCEQARNLFDAYLDGELSAALETELHAHRLQCATCRQSLALMEVTGHVIASGADEPGLGADFGGRLLACLDPELPRPHPARTWIFRIGGVAAAAACLMLLIGHFSGPRPQVAGVVEIGDAVPPAMRPADEPPDETGTPGLDAAAATLRQTLEDAFRETQHSSTSLVRFGRMTLLQMVEALELEALRDSAGHDAPSPDGTPGEDADDIEEL